MRAQRFESVEDTPACKTCSHFYQNYKTNDHVILYICNDKSITYNHCIPGHAVELSTLLKKAVLQTTSHSSNVRSDCLLQHFNIDFSV